MTFQIFFMFEKFIYNKMTTFFQRTIAKIFDMIFRFILLQRVSWFGFDYVHCLSANNFRRNGKYTIIIIIMN